MSNIQPYIIINGVNSRTISGLLITSLPPISKPQQRTQVETVDGRSGDIITPLGFSAYDKTVSIGLTYNYDIDEVIEFFNTSGTVIFSNEPTKYYRFAIYEQIDFEKLIKFKTAEVVLHVQPYKFSTTEEPLLFNDPIEISVENNGNTDARPNLLITGSGDIDVSLNGSQLLSMDLGEDDQTVIIDSENMNAYGAQSAIREAVANIEPKQAGSGDPSPDNIREISGYSEANITRCGVNLFDKTNASAIINGYIWTTQIVYAQNMRTVFAKCKPSTRYTISKMLGQRFIVGYTKELPDINVEVFDVITDNTATHISITTGADAKYIVAFVFNGNVDSGTAEEMLASVQIAEGTDTTYHAYNGSIYNIAFTDGDNPLTVYGGKLNVTTGELKVTHGKFLFDGSSNIGWSKDSSVYGDCLRFNYVNDLIKPSTDALSNYLPNYRNLQNNREQITILGASRLFIILLKANRLESANVEGLMEYFSTNNLEVVYELADPITYQLTPTQINNLLGLNNLYSDTGSLSVKYKSGGVIQTQSGDIVTFTVGVGDMDKGTLLNRLITGNYDKIRLKKGENVISFTGNVKQVSIDKYSRWI